MSQFVHELKNKISKAQYNGDRRYQLFSNVFIAVLHVFTMCDVQDNNK